MPEKERVQATLKREIVFRLEELCRYYGVSKSAMIAICIGSEYAKMAAARSAGGAGPSMVSQSDQ